MAAARSHLWIAGRVQGVGFRVAAMETSRRLGLAGWVRNLADGRVEVVAEGGLAELERFRRWCRHGPPGARVDAVEEAPVEAPRGLRRPFRVRASAPGG